MSTTVEGVFVNLPVQDLKRSIAFFSGLGFSFNAQFTDDSATCLVLGPNHNVMLLAQARFKEFLRGPLGDPRQSTQSLIALQLPSRAAVDALLEKVLAHGGSAYRDTEDLGFMYTRSFRDPDGHVWEPFHMDISKFPKPA